MNQIAAIILRELTGLRTLQLGNHYDYRSKLCWTDTDGRNISMLAVRTLHSLLIDTRVMKIFNLMDFLTGLELQKN